MRAATSIFFLLFAIALPVHAQTGTTTVEQEYLEAGKVLDASISSEKIIEGTGVKMKTQTITVEVLEGVDKGTQATFENDFTQVKKGDRVYVRHIVGGFAPESWNVSDPYRLNILVGLGLVFLILTFLIGGWQGIRGLASLLGSFVLIFTVLLPGIYAGISPILVALGVSSLIIIVGSYITHGFTRTTSVAVLSMLATVLLTGALAYVSVHSAQLSGFTTEENVYLNFNTDGKIDMVGLLFGGIMIGLLGVLYDIAIGQAIAVEELVRTGSLSRAQVFKRGMRVGREHIGALVNILAIAYVGTALPLLLLFHDATASVAYLINSEIFATEIIRILIGSIGLILAVPITTYLATVLLYGRTFPHPSHSHSH